jgi:predicted dinucleotide-binding enzyme
MNYSIIGSGKIGPALAWHFARNEIPVAIANTRGPQSLAALAKELGNTVLPQTLQDALQADCIILAVPFGSLHSVASARPDWKGKLVIDTTNAFGVPLEVLGDSPSSSLVARTFPGARVAKAFNHLPAALLASDPAAHGGRRVVFVSSDDATASEAVAALAGQLGFAPIELGKFADGGALLNVRGATLGSLLLQNLVQVGEVAA